MQGQRLAGREGGVAADPVICALHLAQHEAEGADKPAHNRRARRAAGETGALRVRANQIMAMGLPVERDGVGIKQQPGTHAEPQARTSAIGLFKLVYSTMRRVGLAGC